MDTSLRTEKRAQKKKEKKYAHNWRTLAYVNVLSGKKSYIDWTAFAAGRVRSVASHFSRHVALRVFAGKGTQYTSISTLKWRFQRLASTDWAGSAALFYVRR